MSFKFLARLEATATCSSPDKSILFTINTSAASICSDNNSGTCLPASQSPGSTHPCLSPDVSQLIQSVPNVELSTNVTTFSILASLVAGCFTNSASAQLFLTATGSATPLSSTTMASNSLFPFPLFINFSTEVNISPARSQHAHPFCNSIVSSFEMFGFASNLLSILMDATSFTMIPIFFPSLFCKRLDRVVVLPLPRNPANKVIGIRSSVSFS